VKAKFAHTQALLGANWRAEDAAGHRARLVKLAAAGLRIEHRTGLVVGEFFKALAECFFLIENSCDGIAGKVGGKADTRVASTLTDCGSTMWSARLQLLQASLQAKSIELVDGKRSNAALRATGTADQPSAAAPGGISERGVNDLDQFLIPGSGKSGRHTISIA